MAKPESPADEIKARARGLADDLGRQARHVADEAAEALDDAKERGAEFVEAARRRGSDYAGRARNEAERLYHRGERRMDDAARHAGEYYDGLSDMVRRHPAQALGIAAGAGFLLGLIVARR